MRSELVFGAMAHVKNRYLLARLTSKTMRIFHRRHTRLEETANEVLRLFSFANPQEVQFPPSSVPSHSLEAGRESANMEIRLVTPDIAVGGHPRWSPTAELNL